MLSAAVVLLALQGKPVTLRMIDFRWEFDRGEGVIRTSQAVSFTSRAEVRRFEATMTNRFGRKSKVPVAMRLVLSSDGNVQIQAYAVPDVVGSNAANTDMVTLVNGQDSVKVRRGTRIKIKRGFLEWDRPRSERLTQKEPFAVTLAKGDSVPAFVAPGVRLLDIRKIVPVVKAAAKDHPLSAFVSRHPDYLLSRIPRRLENNADLSLLAGDAQALPVQSEIRLRLILD